MVFLTPGTDKSRINPDKTTGVTGGYYAQHIPVATRDRNILMTPDDSRRDVRQNTNQMQVQTLNQSWSLQPDTFFDAKLTGAPVHTLQDWYLHITYQNTSANGIIPMLPWWFFNRWEVMANGSSNDDTIYPQQMLQSYLMWLDTDTERMNRAPTVGMDDSSSAGTVGALGILGLGQYDEADVEVPAGTTKEYYIPLLCFLTQCNLWLPTKGVDPIVRCYGNVNAICSDNDAGDLAAGVVNWSLSQAEMYVTGIVYAAPLMQKLNKYYQSTELVCRVLTHERASQSISSLTPGEPTADFSMNSIAGEYLMLWCVIMRGNATREQLYSSNRTYTAATQGWMPMDQISLTDSSGNPVNFLNMKVDFHRLAQGSTFFPHTCYFGYKNICPYVFGVKPLMTFKTGRSSGGLALDGSFKLNVIPRPYTAGSTTSWSLTVYGTRYGLLTLTHKGALHLQKL
jgi:hypothetical protein